VVFGHDEGMRLLVVDDEPRLAEGLKRGLEAEGFAVDVAHTGTDGLWLAREQDYAAILLDIMLPGVNGYVVCRTLRAEQNWTPVLMLTAKDGEWDQVEGLDTGADDYLTKPFSFAILLARVRALIRRGAAPRPVVLAVDDLVLDPAARSVGRGGVPIDLTTREFAVLEFLMRSAGDVVSKQQILDGVWDFAFNGDPNIVEVYIGHLRAKVDRPFGRSTIRTLRGAGYRIGGDDG
jgi:DNA-binding response OmpR family regulator